MQVGIKLSLKMAGEGNCVEKWGSMDLIEKRILRKDNLSVHESNPKEGIDNHEKGLDAAAHHSSKQPQSRGGDNWKGITTAP